MAKMSLREKLAKQAELDTVFNKPKKEKKDYTDPRFWVLPKDVESKNGSATIRFLPATDGDDTSIVEVYEHSIKFPKPTSKPGWFIENCPSTVGGKCPACSEYFKGWEANKGLAKNEWDKSHMVFKRKTQYITNILVVKDDLKPENDGKVFLFKFGTELYEILERTQFPEKNDEYDEEVDGKGFNPKDMYEGANLRLRLSDRGGEEFKTYKTSKFLSQSPISDDEAKMAKIWESQYSLAEFIDKDAVDYVDKKTLRFKTYEQLEERLAKAMGLISDEDAERVTAVEATQEPVVAKTKIKKPVVVEEEVEEEMDDDDAEIRRMVEEMKNGTGPL